MIIHKKAIEQASRDPKVMVRWVGRWRRIQLLSHSSGKDSQFNIQVPPNVVELSSIQIFKRRMNKHLNNQKLWPGEWGDGVILNYWVIRRVQITKGEKMYHLPYGTKLERNPCTVK